MDLLTPDGETLQHLQVEKREKCHKLGPKTFRIASENLAAKTFVRDVDNNQILFD